MDEFLIEMAIKIFKKLKNCVVKLTLDAIFSSFQCPSYTIERFGRIKFTNCGVQIIYSLSPLVSLPKYT